MTKRATMAPLGWATWATGTAISTALLTRFSLPLFLIKGVAHVPAGPLVVRAVDLKAEKIHAEFRRGDGGMADAQKRIHGKPCALEAVQFHRN